MKEVAPELGSFFENPGNAIDYSFKFTSGESLSMVGISKENKVVPVGSAPYDVKVVLSSKTGEEETDELSRYGSTDIYLDEDWCKKLVLALGRQSPLWLESYNLSNMLEFAVDCHESAPTSQGSEEYKKEEQLWVEEIIGAIDNQDYKHIWDFEGHRDDGPDYYDEWFYNTEEFRR